MSRLLLPKVKSQWLSMLLLAVNGALIGIYIIFPASASDPLTHSLIHRLGVYSMTDGTTVPQAAATGITLAIAPHLASNSPLLSQFKASNISYIEGQIKNSMYAHFCKNKDAHGFCVMTTAEETSFENEVAPLIDSYKNDPNFIGYYVMDDYWGDLTTPLTALHRMIQQANATSTIGPKFTLCGLGGDLDFRPTPGADWADPSVYDSYFDRRVLSNFSPSNCDAINLYIYTPTRAPKGAVPDWQMSRLLPKLISLLKAHGWNPDQTPLIGTPQAMGYPDGSSSTTPPYYPTPGASDLAAQTTAFCQNGASAIIAYNWQTSYNVTKNELFNTSSLRDGLKEGFRQCQSIWGVAVGSPLPPPSIVPPTLAPTALPPSQAGATTTAGSKPLASGVAVTPPTSTNQTKTSTGETTAGTIAPKYLSPQTQPVSPHLSFWQRAVSWILVVPKAIWRFIAHKK